MDDAAMSSQDTAQRLLYSKLWIEESPGKSIPGTYSSSAGRIKNRIKIAERVEELEPVGEKGGQEG